MLTFLAVACKKKFLLDEYVDDAVGHMEKNADGKLAITRVELHPKLKFSGEKQPTEQELDEMHHFAHDRMFHRQLGQDQGNGREIIEPRTRGSRMTCRRLRNIALLSNCVSNVRSAQSRLLIFLTHDQRTIRSGWRKSSACASGGDSFSRRAKSTAD